MNNERALVDHIFNGQRFQKFSAAEKDTGDTVFVFCVDGLPVPRREWTQLREAAIAAELRQGLIKE